MTHGRRALCFVAAAVLVACGRPEPASQVTEASVRAHLAFLASDALNGRASGTRDEWIAATYVATRFDQWGLEPVGNTGEFVQAIEIVSSRVTSPPTMTAGDRTLTHGREMVVSGMPRPHVTARLVPYQPDADVPPDAAVLLPSGVTPDPALGSAMVLAPVTESVRGRWDQMARRLPPLPTEIVGTEPPLDRPVIIYLDDGAIEDLRTLDEGTEVVLSAESEPAPSRHTWNAIGQLTGSDEQLADEVIVLGAHLDHTGARDVPDGEDGINNGADDNASGTVAVMELARVLADGPRPARTVVFALFGSEERGGFGSRYFIDAAVVPLDAIVADIQFEMIGRPDPLVPPGALWLTGYERSNLGAELAAFGAPIVADPHPDENFFGRSDNVRFARRGVVAHTVSTFGLHEDYHRPSDDTAGIDLAHMTGAIGSLVEPLWRLANSDFMPEWVEGGCPDPCGP